jgi:hypothetical protein
MTSPTHRCTDRCAPWGPNRVPRWRPAFQLFFAASRHMNLCMQDKKSLSISAIASVETPDTVQPVIFCACASALVVLAVLCRTHCHGVVLVLVVLLSWCCSCACASALVPDVSLSFCDGLFIPTFSMSFPSVDLFSLFRCGFRFCRFVAVPCSCFASSRHHFAHTHTLTLMHARTQ